MSSKFDVTVSLLIPTYNAGGMWQEVLQSIDKQDYPLHRKIIVDSGSTDATVDLARSHGFEVIEIPQHSFNHGGTRQLLADESGAAICIFITQDAIFDGTDSISNIVSVFDDPSLGIAYGRQLPHNNAQPLEVHARLFNYPGESHVRSHSDKDKLGFKVFFCSNSFSAYREKALKEVGGFPVDSIMGEDAIVAAKMLSAGFKKAYVANATVRHSHSYTVLEEFKRYFDTSVFHQQNKWLIEQYGKPTGEGLRFMRSELQYAFHQDKKLIFKSIFSLGAKWLGYKMGSFYDRLSIGVIRKLSMHRYFWR